MKRQLGGNWVEGRVVHDGQPYRYQALLFDEGSPFGIDGGRVSKLWIAALEGSPADGAHRSRPVYNYDRGLDFDRAPAALLEAVLADCTREG